MAVSAEKKAVKVLIIDDSNTIRRSAEIFLRQAGYEVTVEPKQLNLGGLDVTIAFFNGPCGESIEFFQVHQNG